MIKNSTVIDNTTIIVALPLTSYDANGTMIYIVTVLLWYSIGIIFMLGMQMFARREDIEDFARHRTRFLIRNLSDHTNTKQILEELADKQNRDRLWDIYLGTTLNTKDRLTRAENLRIRHIVKQLATIKRNRRLNHDTLSPFINAIRYTRTRSVTSQFSSETISTLRHRSSLDQQTLERWKELDNRSKLFE